MPPSPSRPVTLQPQDPLQTEGAGTVFLGSYPPHRPEPQPQGTPGILKDCSRRDRGKIIIGMLAVVSGLPLVSIGTLLAWRSIMNKTNGAIVSSGVTRRYLL